MKLQTTRSNRSVLVRFIKATFMAGLLSTLVSLVSLQTSLAGSATWNQNPTSGDWNTAANWTPATVPNGVSDVATFDVSNMPGINVFGATLDGIVFNPGASAFTIGNYYGVLSISGAGITNNSGLTQNFVTSSGSVEFDNSATAGSATFFATPEYCTTSFFDTTSAGTAAFLNSNDSGSLDAGRTAFFNNATAASASFTIKPSPVIGRYGGFIEFHDSATAANATFDTGGGLGNGYGLIRFYDTATAADAMFTNRAGDTGGNVDFFGSSTAGNATFINEASEEATGGGVGFLENSSAGTATVISQGAALSGASGGTIAIAGAANGDHATFINYGGRVTGAYGANMYLEHGSAGDSTIIVNGGVDGGRGAFVFFTEHARGANARLQVYGNGTAELQNTDGVFPNTLGSIEGDGTINIAGTELTVGSNNLSTTFSGYITDYGYYGVVAGSLIKTGQGTLTLTNATFNVNRYSGGTIVERGRLIVNNDSGSGTGSGGVQVAGGTLGGKGFITGPVTIGTGQGGRGNLAPGVDGLGLLKIQGTLTFGINGTYNWNVNAETSAADEVRAIGVTISPGALFSPFGRVKKAMAAGTVLTVIDNRAVTPISGVFDNLPDAGTITAGPNTFQANYEGGDGNDLTLTVVP